MCRFGKHVKGFYRIPREELWYCMRKHVMKYLIVMQDTEPLLAVVMDSLADEVRQESLSTVMFADDIVICSEIREGGGGSSLQL